MELNTPNNNQSEESNQTHSEIESTRKLLEKQKIEFEIELIRQNINELKRPWYKKPLWISALAPVIVGICTLIVITATGYLQKQAALNKLERIEFERTKNEYDSIINNLKLKTGNLKQEVHILSNDKNILIQANDDLRQISDSLKLNFNSENDKIKFLTKRYFILQDENGSLRSQIIYFKDSLKRLRYQIPKMNELDKALEENRSLRGQIIFITDSLKRIGLKTTKLDDLDKVLEENGYPNEATQRHYCELKEKLKLSGFWDPGTLTFNPPFRDMVTQRAIYFLENKYPNLKIINCEYIND